MGHVLLFVYTNKSIRLQLMPTISMFYGIIIAMYYNDHNPPHIHAKYNEYEATVDIKTLKITGKLPTNAKKWIKKNNNALLENWSLAKGGLPLKKVPPIE